MAWIEKRGGGSRTVWESAEFGRLSFTWPDEPTAKKAKDIADANRNKITLEDLYLRTMGKPFPAPSSPAGGPSFRTFAVARLEDRLTRGKIQVGTYNNYLRQLEQEVFPAIGDLPIADITADHISTLIGNLRTKFRNATVTRYFAITSSIFEDATRDRSLKLAANPARYTDFKRDRPDPDGGRRREEDKWQEYWELARIYSFMKEDARPVLMFMIETGCRIGEACAVQKRDHDPVKGVVTIRRNFKSDMKGKVYLGQTKAEEERVLTISPELNKIMSDLTEHRPGTSFVFRSPRGKQLRYNNFYNRRWTPAIRAAARCADHPPAGKAILSPCDCPGPLHRIPNPHGVRHSYTTWMLLEGRSTSQVAADLGLSTTAMVERRYSHLRRINDVSRVNQVQEIRSKIFG